MELQAFRVIHPQQSSLAKYWCIADNTVDTCIYLNHVIFVVFFLTEMFAVDYQVSDKRPLGI